MKKNAKLFIGLACLSLGLTACSDDEIYTEADKLQNAETALGVKIDPNHEWRMTQDVTASITVNLGMDQQYTVVVYDKNPLFNKNVSYYGRTTVAEGKTATMTFSVPSAKNVFYVGAIDSKKQRVLKTVAVENGMIVANFEGANANSRITRSITVNGDVFSKFPSATDIAAYFPTTIPKDAKTDEELVTEWKGKNAVDENGNEIIAEWGGTIQMWDAYAIYLNMVGKVINNIKVTTPGEYSVGQSWANPADRAYNVYIAIGEGNNLTLKRNGAEHVNFYVMSGNITIDSNFGECGGIISVAEGATVNDQRTHIAHNDGVKVFNKGTYNATNTTPYWNGSETTSVFDIGNFCTFYNEGTFACAGGLSYSPGDANDSYFINFGDDAKLTASSMTLNSTGNFFNSGKVTITGETKVTQARLYWVNAGHYTTGTMTFSAKNTTFYNYCQLIVQGNAHMYDGEFNLMQNSYTEAGTAEMDNFIVNMKSNSGMYIKGNVKLEAQEDNTFQGFRTIGNASNTYVLIDGKVTVASHKKTFSISSGITYSINQIEIVREGSVITEEQLQSEQSGDYPVLDLNGIACTYGKLSVTPNTNSCGATWKKDDEEDNSTPKIYSFAFEDTFMGDYDMNDVVLYVSENAEDNTKLDVTLMCTGASFNLYVYFNDEELFGETEVHDLLKNGASGKFINTREEEDGKDFFDGTPYTTTINKPSGDFTISQADFWIKSPQGNIHIGTHYSETGLAPYGIMIPDAWAWPTEFTCITNAYPSFITFARDQYYGTDWYESAPESGTTMAVSRIQ